MNLNRQTLLSLLVADLLVMAGALFVLKDRHRLAGELSAGPASAPAAVAAPSRPAPRAAAPSAPAAAATRAPSGRGGRNILFAYRNSRPHRVEMIASFNDWSPDTMTKGPNHTWTFSAKLEPGDYTYNFIVDGKVIRDPNNPRTAPEGRSLLSVKPLTE
jgi:hypothetical protein